MYEASSLKNIEPELEKYNIYYQSFRDCQKVASSLLTIEAELKNITCSSMFQRLQGGSLKFGGY